MAPEPRVVWMPGGVRTEVHLRGAETGGAFCLLRDELPAGWSLPAHLHRSESETIHVLSGSLAVRVEGRGELLVGAGATIHIPARTLHDGANAGSEPVRRVVIFSPAGIEDFFLDAGAASPEGADARLALAAALRHGWEFPR